MPSVGALIMHTVSVFFVTFCYDNILVDITHFIQDYFSGMKSLIWYTQVLME